MTEAELKSMPGDDASVWRISDNARVETELAESYAFCRELTLGHGGSFVRGIRMTPEPKRAAMFVLYAWMRIADDIADDDRPATERGTALDAFSAQTTAVMRGDEPPQAESTSEATLQPFAKLWPAVADAFVRFGVPKSALDDQLAGQSADLEYTQPETLAQLETYARLVASSVGRCCVAIWGSDRLADEVVDEELGELAARRGIALQLINILRDVREDAARGRIYLPADLVHPGAAHGITPEALTRDPVTFSGAAWCERIAPVLACADEHLRASASLEAKLHPDGRRPSTAMALGYGAMLERIRVRPMRVFEERVAPGQWDRLRILWGVMRAGR